jgi:methylenetetrahydrofolate dehydrogenase (NADP+)/methenyltetrahydrofolate cyclohydrolase
LDGITEGSFAAIYAGECARLAPRSRFAPCSAIGGPAERAGSSTPCSRFAPCSAEGCLALLDYYGIAIAGKRVTVIGRSLVIGRPLAMLFLQRDATVTVCHSKTADLPSACREADIVVAAPGKPEFLGAEYFRPGQVIVDMGIHAREDGSLCGDLDFAKVEPVAGAISPVPGGAGAVTAAVLLAHAVAAAQPVEPGTRNG